MERFYPIKVGRVMFLDLLKREELGEGFKLQ